MDQNIPLTGLGLWGFFNLNLLMKEWVVERPLNGDTTL